MAVPANTRLTFTGIGIREDLSNIIYNISPTDTPFLNGCGRGTADNTLFEKVMIMLRLLQQSRGV